MWPTYENRLQGTGRDGMSIGQQYSAQGSICTLSKPDGKQEAGYYFDQNKTVPAFSTYLTFNTIGLSPEQARDTHYDIVFEASDDKGIAEGDFIYDVHSVSAVSLYEAKISSYHGKGGKVTIPKSMTFTTFDERQVEVPVVEMGPAAFANSKGDIRSLNFLENDGLKNLNVNRSSSTNPFYGINRTAMIYLPDNHGHTASNGEVNVVIGTHCDNLLVIEGLDFEPPYARHRTTAPSKPVTMDRAGGPAWPTPCVFLSSQSCRQALTTHATRSLPSTGSAMSTGTRRK